MREAYKWMPCASFSSSGMANTISRASYASLCTSATSALFHSASRFLPTLKRAVRQRFGVHDWTCNSFVPVAYLI